MSLLVLLAGAVGATLAVLFLYAVVFAGLYFITRQ